MMDNGKRKVENIEKKDFPLSVFHFPFFHL
jgi:hypothetical protein